jgi:hypothetical protein
MVAGAHVPQAPRKVEAFGSSPVLNRPRGVSPLIHRRFRVSCFVETPFGQGAHPFGSSRHVKAIAPRKRGEGEGVMLSSKRCIFNALECLSAAQVADDPYYRGVNLSLTMIWISLARQEEATADLVAGWKALDRAGTQAEGGKSPIERMRGSTSTSWGASPPIQKRSGRKRRGTARGPFDDANRRRMGKIACHRDHDLRLAARSCPRGCAVRSRRVGNAPVRRATYDLAGN